MNIKASNQLILPLFLILAAAASRFLPHPPNFAPVAGMALFAGITFSNKKLSFLVPVVAMLLSDLVIGFHNTMWGVYLSFVLITAMGIYLSGRATVKSIGAAAIASSILFFIVSNFAVWVAGGYYPQTMAGLGACYVAALPFFNYTLVGDLFYTGVLFGSFHVLSRYSIVKA